MRRLATYGGRYPTCQATSNFPHRLCCCFSLSSSSSFLPLYSLPPLSLIISLICRGIRSIQAWILSCSSSCQTSRHAFSLSVRFFGAPFLVVFLFICGQQGSIIFKSGLFPHQSYAASCRDQRLFVDNDGRALEAHLE